MRKYTRMCVDCGQPTSGIRCKLHSNIESAKRRGTSISATWTESRRSKRAEEMLGNKNGVGNMGMTGKNHTEDHKRRMSVMMTGRKVSEATRAKLLASARRGSESPNWKGGRIIDGHGYVKIRIGQKYLFEHRLVMERMLGRSLTDEEQVHHKDANRQNNDPSNLELRSGPHGVGATKHCPTCTCC